MTREETDKILFVVRASYPENFARMGKMDIELLSMTWQTLLQSYTYDQVSTGLFNYIKTDKYGRAPKVGQIIDAMEITNKPIENVNEAWAKVYKAICNSNYNAEEEFAKLDPILQKTVGDASNLRQFAAMDIKDVEVTVKAHFKSIYEVEVKRQADAAKIAPTMDAISGQTAARIETN